MSDMEVSWYPSYSIHIDGVDGDIVFHLSQALKQYLENFPGQIDDLNQNFKQIIRSCEAITEIDEKD